MDELINRLRSFRDRRNWAQFHTPKDLAISVSIEAGELLEVFQWSPASAPLDQRAIDRVASEAADVVIYLLLLADRVGFDLVDEANKKVEENERRFPEKLSFGVAKPTKDN